MKLDAVSRRDETDESPLVVDDRDRVGLGGHHGQRNRREIVLDAHPRPRPSAQQPLQRNAMGVERARRPPQSDVAVIQHADRTQMTVNDDQVPVVSSPHPFPGAPQRRVPVGDRGTWVHRVRRRLRAACRFPASGGEPGGASVPLPCFWHFVLDSRLTGTHRVAVHHSSSSGA
jgi:hypothetical protein